MPSMGYFYFAEYIPQLYRVQVSQGNSFSNILITGNAPVRSVVKLEWCQAKCLQKAPCPVGADPADNFGKLNTAAIFF